MPTGAVLGRTNRCSCSSSVPPAAEQAASIKAFSGRHCSARVASTGFLFALLPMHPALSVSQSHVSMYVAFTVHQCNANMQLAIPVQQCHLSTHLALMVP